MFVKQKIDFQAVLIYTYKHKGENMPVAFIVTIVLVIIAFGTIILTIYSKLLKLNVEINNAWSEINYQLKCRSELIPKLVEIIKKDLKKENELVKAFSDAERKMDGARTISATMEADREFTEAFSYLIMVSESNSKLKTDTAFQQIISEFLSIEERIQVARRSYNIYAEKNNIKISSFPSNLVNSLIGHFKIRKYYELEKTKSKKR